MSVGVLAINEAIDNEPESLLQSLSNPEVYLHSVSDECTVAYHNKLQDYKRRKIQAAEMAAATAGGGDGKGASIGSGWMMNRTREGYKYYFNVHTMEADFVRKDYMKKDSGLLTRDEVQTCVAEVTAQHDRHLLFKANEKTIVKLQAQARGYMARKKHEERQAFIRDKLPAIIKIQVRLSKDQFSIALGTALSWYCLWNDQSCSACVVQSLGLVCNGSFYYCPLLNFYHPV